MINTLKNHIFIQARLYSERLPKKILKEILGQSILSIIKKRLEIVDNVDHIYLVTGSPEKNNLLINEAKKLDLDIFCGCDKNILDRFYQASNKFGSDNIIRITGDNPLLDPFIINKGLAKFLESNVDILSNDRKPTFPKGLNFEIFKKSALDSSWLTLSKKYSKQQNFLNTFMTPVNDLLFGNFKNHDFLSGKNHSKLRLTMDHNEDYDFITKLFEILYPQKYNFDLNDILECLRENPQLLSINNQNFAIDN